MNLEQAKKLYLSGGGINDYSESEWKDIHREMEAIVAAKSDRAAARIIDWWGCWTPRDNATMYARKIREAYETGRSDKES